MFGLKTILHSNKYIRSIRFFRFASCSNSAGSFGRSDEPTKSLHGDDGKSENRRDDEEKKEEAGSVVQGNTLNATHEGDDDSSNDVGDNGKGNSRQDLLQKRVIELQSIVQDNIQKSQMFGEDIRMFGARLAETIQKRKQLEKKKQEMETMIQTIDSDLIDTEDKFQFHKSMLERELQEQTELRRIEFNNLTNKLKREKQERLQANERLNELEDVIDDLEQQLEEISGENGKLRREHDGLQYVVAECTPKAQHAVSKRNHELHNFLADVIQLQLDITEGGISTSEIKHRLGDMKIRYR